MFWILKSSMKCDSGIPKMCPKQLELQPRRTCHAPSLHSGSSTLESVSAVPSVVVCLLTCVVLFHPCTQQMLNPAVCQSLSGLTSIEQLGWQDQVFRILGKTDLIWAGKCIWSRVSLAVNKSKGEYRHRTSNAEPTARRFRGLEKGLSA